MPPCYQLIYCTYIFTNKLFQTLYHLFIPLTWAHQHSYISCSHQPVCKVGLSSRPTNHFKTMTSHKVRVKLIFSATFQMNTKNPLAIFKELFFSLLVFFKHQCVFPSLALTVIIPSHLTSLLNYSNQSQYI